MKRKINITPIALIVFLLVTNITTIITYRNHLAEEQRIGEYREDLPESRIGPYLRDVLELNENQMEEFRTFRRTYNRSVNRLLNEMQGVRDEMVEVLKSKQPNRTKLDNLAADLGQKHKELKGLTFDYYFNMQSVLAEEQKELMVDIFQAMLTEQGYAKTPEHGNLSEEGNGEHTEGRGFGRGNGKGDVQNHKSGIETWDTIVPEENYRNYEME